MEAEEFRSLFDRLNIYRCVILASTFRSGSSYVASLLHRNGLEGLGNERFNSMVRQTPETVCEHVLDILAPFKGALFPTKLMWPHRNAVARATGISRRESEKFAELFPETRWVFVERNDVFGQAVSMWRAKKTGRWHVYDDTPEPVPEYDFEGIDASLRELHLHNRLWMDFFSLSGIKPHRITYEELECNIETQLSALLDFLGLDRETPSARVGLRKQRDDVSADYRERLMEDLYRLDR